MKISIELWNNTFCPITRESTEKGKNRERPEGTGQSGRDERIALLGNSIYKDRTQATVFPAACVLSFIRVTANRSSFLWSYPRRDWMQASTSFMSAVGSKQATTFPSLSTTNFVKFHLISGFLSHSGSFAPASVQWLLCIRAHQSHQSLSAISARYRAAVHSVRSHPISSSVEM